MNYKPYFILGLSLHNLVHEKLDIHLRDKKVYQKLEVIPSLFIEIPQMIQ